MLAIVAVSCVNDTEQPATRAGSLFSFRSVEVAGVGTGMKYHGTIATWNNGAGSWYYAPNSPYRTEWSCEFVNGSGVVSAERNRHYYPEGEYDFYLLGVNNSNIDITPDANGRVAVVGGAEGGNDYIWATVSAEVDGKKDIEVTPEFTHLFGQVSFELKVRGIGDVPSEMVSFDGLDQLGYCTRGTVDITKGEFVENSGSDVLSDSDITLGKRYMVIPGVGGNYCDITVTIDGKAYPVSINKGNTKITAGKRSVILFVYNGFGVSMVEIPQWSIGEDISIDRTEGDGYDIPQWQPESDLPQENK